MDAKDSLLTPFRLLYERQHFPGVYQQAAFFFVVCQAPIGVYHDSIEVSKLICRRVNNERIDLHPDMMM